MLKVYDPDQVSVIFAGVQIQGYADGEFLRVEQTTENFTSVVGTDGEVVRSKTNDRRATVAFVLLQTSESNGLLSAIANADISLPNGAGVGALYIRDRQGTTIYAAAEAWIQKPPDASFGREAGSREWIIECARLERFDGGN